MRAIISKVLTGSIIAGAALAVSACGSKTENTTDANMTTEMNASEGMDTATDNMTAVDGTMNGGMMANDTMSNDMMMANDTMTTNATNAM
ncbi:MULTISPECIES: hypothetical protein [Sphingomonas]|jgi:hypothetical protein|uniref:Circumsporozoite protein n=2 Tax=Sphingomonas TaxID=13687 RepID=A0A7Y6EHB1_9SPHN|nr:MULTISPECIES: hypothetical protein [Sphingomonas]MBB4048184.1 hypothetical protein [Sphingomonas zeae]MDK8184737.1 hypothetical protein [Sphingomonas zeae]MDK8215458.1 hypothetical protein [Sphingomonas sp. UMB7805-LC452B]MDZ7283532.1 hypothetical protein [Sphingomonas sanguinis]NUU46912.1 hypothetical protein [Sphingomonas zeae]